jgi:hypothetical protein
VDELGALAKHGRAEVDRIGGVVLLA